MTQLCLRQSWLLLCCWGRQEDHECSASHRITFDRSGVYTWQDMTSKHSWCKRLVLTASGVLHQSCCVHDICNTDSCSSLICWYLLTAPSPGMSAEICALHIFPNYNIALNREWCFAPCNKGMYFSCSLLALMRCRILRDLGRWHLENLTCKDL